MPNERRCTFRRHKCAVFGSSVTLGGGEGGQSEHAKRDISVKVSMFLITHGSFSE